MGVRSILGSVMFLREDRWRMRVGHEGGWAGKRRRGDHRRRIEYGSKGF